DRDVTDAGAGPTEPLSVPAASIPCDKLALLDSGRVGIAKNLDPAGDERLTIQGQFRVASDAPVVDPLTNGLRFRVDDKDGVPIFVRVVPGGTPISTTPPGRSRNRPGHKAPVKDLHRTRPPGL